MNVIMLGLPGAGKGTQAKFIAESQRIPHISTGDLFRQAYQDQTKLGILAKEYMSKGGLVPDDVTIGIALNRLEQADCEHGFLLDGFPRNIAQAISLREFLINKSSSVNHVIYVEVNEDVLVERLTGRRVCSKCGETYHIINNPPAQPGLCNTCWHPLIQREDDSEDTVRERLNVNKELTLRLCEFYNSEGTLRTVDGLRPMDEVTAQIKKVIGP